MEHFFLNNEQLLAQSIALLLLIIAFFISIRARKRNKISKKITQEDKTQLHEIKKPLPSKTITEDASETLSDEIQLKETQPEVLTEQSKIAHVAKQEPAATINVLDKIRNGLQKTRGNLTTGLSSLLLGSKTVDAKLLEEIESQLIMADVGVTTTQEIIKSLTTKLKHKKLADSEQCYATLKQELSKILQECNVPLTITKRSAPFVILMVGVNGAGKTTTIGKLAKHYQNQGLSVMLAAGDTFRAAAVEQLCEWGDRNKVPVISQHTGADCASVIYDSIAAATARNIDVLIADTAGRLQNKDNLMSELAKVKRVMGKIDSSAPHEVMLILDAATGQNAISQAKIFNDTIGVTGITLTKLDGTAKGGVIFAIAQQLKLPLRFIGVGEQVDDLKVFNADQFVTALFD